MFGWGFGGLRGFGGCLGGVLGKIQKDFGK